MWRAVERWGAQIKSGLNFGFISKLFNKKQPRDYNEFETDSQDEIFSDAREDVLDDDYDDDTILMRTSESSAQLGGASGGVVSEQNGKPLTGLLDKQEGLLVSYNPSGQDPVKLDRNSSNCELSQHETSETKAFIKTPKSSKTHKRNDSKTSLSESVDEFVSGIMQRKYNRLDNTEEHPDENDNDTVDQNGDVHTDNDIQVFKDISDVNPNLKEKKPKRRKKIAKRTRSVVRRSWKWIKRGFAGYAKVFNAPTFFIVTSAGAAVQKRSY